MQSFFDHAQIMENLYTKVLRAVKEFFPFRGNRKTLKLNKLWYDDKLDIHDIANQQKTKISNKSWEVPIYADISLIDNETKKEIDRVRKIRLLSIPHITHRFSYIVDGTEYQIPTQMRLKPGMYVHEKGDGLFRGWFNLAKGMEREFAVYLNPKTKKLNLAYGTTKAIPLYSILKSMDITEEAMKTAWGGEIFKLNKKSMPSKGIETLYKAMFNEDLINQKDAIAKISSRFTESTMDPKVNELTLNKAYTNVSPQSILAMSKKVLNVSRGIEKEDDTHSLVYKNVMTVDDFLEKRIQDSVRRITRKIKNNLDRKDKVKDILSYDIFNLPVKTFFTSTSLSNSAEHPSILGYLTEHSKITPLGEGGIENIYQVHDAARALNPSHIGFIDPVLTPDNDRAGVLLHLSTLAGKRGTDLTIAVYGIKEKTLVEVTPLELSKAIVAFRNQYDSNYKPKRKIIEAIKNTEILKVQASEVDYIFIKDSFLFSLDTNLVPFLQNTQGNRATLSSKMLHAAVSLVDPEAPLVRNKFGAKTTEKFIGDLINVDASLDGEIVGIDRDKIIIKGKDGKKEKVGIYNNFHIGENSFIDSTPVVKIGDKVKYGQLIATSNYSDKEGNFAYGKNLNVGYLSFKGLNTDDGVVISEAAAKKLTSRHIYKIRVHQDKNTVLDLKKFSTLYPTAITIAQMNKLDESGIIKKGSIIYPDEIVVAVLKRESPDIQDIVVRKLYKKIMMPFKNRAILWDNKLPGKVVDVQHHGKAIDIYIKTREPATIGDKLCYDKKTEILTDSGWIHFSELTYKHKVCCLNPKTDKIIFEPPIEIYEYEHKKRMYKIKSQQIDLVTTDNHKMYVRLHGKTKFELKEVKDIFGKHLKYKKDGIWKGKRKKYFTLPSITGHQNKKFLMKDWLEFLGWYLSEGHVNSHKSLKGGRYYRIVISQSRAVNTEKYNEIVRCISRLGFNYREHEKNIRINNKQLYKYLKQFGKCYEKFIPRWVFDLHSEYLKILLESLIKGDGYKGKTSDLYISTSKQLTDGVQELALKLGLVANIRVKNRSGNVGGVLICGRPIISRRTSWVTTITKNRKTPEVNHGGWKHNKYKEEYINYSGKVFCCTVPTGIIYVRRNGKPVWSGNSGRHGNKGVISYIIPDKDMPEDKDGNKLEVIYSPAVVTTRMNVGQIYETMASKIAEKKGEPYISEIFPQDDKSTLEEIKKELKKYGISDTTKLFDPASNKELGEILTGKQYILKLKQKVAGILASRSGGKDPYTINRIAKGGGPTAGQAIGHLGLYSMLAHGAPANLLEMNTYKTDMNPDFWHMVQSGQPLPPPKIPFAYEKFMGYLKAMGVNVEKRGHLLQMLPLTDADVKKISNGAIDPTRIIRGKDLRPEKNGLFDEDKTGGEQGDRWTHINLAEAMPNPMFEDAIISLLEIDGKIYDDILHSRIGVTLEGKLSSDGKLRRGKAFEKLLSDINVKKERQKTKNKLSSASGTELSKLRRKYKILRALDDSKLSPEKAYIRKTVPVLPPYFRPIIQLPRGGISVDDLNGLYRNIGIMNKSLKEAKEVLPEEEIAQTYANLYDSIKGMELSGAKIGNKKFVSVMDIIKGGSPKDGFFQRALINRRKQDVSGRSVIVPDIGLSLDEVGIPEKMAWKIFEPFIVRRLVLQGYKPNEAMKLVDDRHSFARKALDMEMNERPVFFKRDPVLHKFGVMAMKPKIVTGESIHTNPIYMDAYGGDYDGDTCSNIHIPIFIDKDEIISHLTNNGILSNSYDNDQDLSMNLMQEPIHGIINNTNKGGQKMPNKNESIQVRSRRYPIMAEIIEFKDFPRDEKSKQEKGNKEIYKVPPGIKVLSYDEKTKSVGLASVTEFSIHKDVKFVKVKTKFNREITVTPDHSLFCINEEFILVKTTPEDALNKLTPRPKRFPTLEKLQSVDVSGFFISSESKKAKKISTTLDLTNHSGYTLGILCSEGWAQKQSRTVCFASVEEDVIKHTTEGMSKYFCNDLTFTKHSQRNQDFNNGKYLSTRITTYSTELACLVGELIGYGAKNKHLPPFFLSTNEDFRLGLLAGLISGDGTVSIVKAKSKNKSQPMIAYCTISPTLAYEVSILATSLGIRSSITEYEKTGISAGTGTAFNITMSPLDFVQYKNRINLHHERKQKKLEEILDWPWDYSAGALVKNDILPFNKQMGEYITQNIIKPKTDRNLYLTIRAAIKKGFITRYSALQIIEYITKANNQEVPFYKEWLEIVNNHNILWDQIKSVTPELGEGTIGYDITVPGSYTFMTAAQIIPFDTMSIYVPVSPEAVREMPRMFPSNNLISPTSGKPVYYPKQESLLGLYLMSKKGKETKKTYKSLKDATDDLRADKIKMNDVITINRTKTTVGRAMINDVLPAELRIKSALDSKVMSSLMINLAKKYPNKYSSIVDKLKTFGFDSSYTSGFSLSLSDFDSPDKAKNKKIWEDAELKVFGKNLSDEEQIEIFSKAKDDADILLQDSLSDEKNNLYRMAIAGAKGKFTQVAQILGSVGLVEDLHGDVNPHPITSNFSTGLGMPEYWTHLHGARKGLIQKVKEVKDPGYLSKQVVNNLLDSVVSEDDCGTKRGILMRISDSEILDRYINQKIKLGDESVPIGTLTTPELLSRLRKHKIISIVVRSPIRCEAAQGICKKCMGLNEKGQEYSLGDRVGIIATQSIGEPSVQLTLSSWHKGGLTEKTVAPMARLQQLLHLTKNIKHKATLSIAYGTVEKISTAAVGGYDVIIKGKNHWVPRGLALKVKVGSKVKKGQVISAGYIDPRELLTLRGIEATQNYLIDEVYDVLKDSGPVKRKNIELVIRSIASIGEIENEGGHPYYIKGDLAPLSKLNYFNRSDRSRKLSPRKSIGLRLKESFGGVKAGTILTEDMIKKIDFPSEIEVILPPIRYKPVIRGIDVAPREVIEDWMAKLNFHHIKETLLDSAMFGSFSDLHGLNPIPSIARGVDILDAHRIITGE